MGTPQFAAPSLNMLIDEGYDLAAVVTQPDRPKGRAGKPAPPVIKEIAESRGVRVLQPEKPDEICGIVSELSVDLCITAAYGEILRKRFIRLPKFGTINVHASLLPQYRGSSPIHRALQNGDSQTGVSIMLTEAGVDTGPVLMSEAIAIAADMYYAELHDRLSELGARMLKKAVPGFLSGALKPVPQDGRFASYAPIVQKSDGTLDFSLNAGRLVNIVRAFSVWPGANAVIHGINVKVHKAVAGASEAGEAAAAAAAIRDKQGAGVKSGEIVAISRNALSVVCGDGSVFSITRLQFENGRAMDISECWHNLRHKFGVA